MQQGNFSLPIDFLDLKNKVEKNQNSLKNDSRALARITKIIKNPYLEGCKRDFWCWKKMCGKSGKLSIERFFTVNMFDEVPRTRADHIRRVKTPFLLIIAVCRLRNKFSCLGEIEWQIICWVISGSTSWIAEEFFY